MLSIIIVSWNVRDLLRGCLASIEAERGTVEVEIIVVDNGSQDGTPEMVRRDFPGTTLIEPGRNLGFSAGNNLGLRQARGRWLMLLNPDTELLEGALPALLAFMEGHPAVGVVGPEIWYGDGTRQATRHRFPSPLTLALASTPLHERAAPLLRRYYLADRPAHEPHPVDWLSGAALLLRREVYEGVGGLDERFFMYFEETDWQRRIKAAGWPVWFVPTARVRHFEDASSGQVAPLRAQRFNRSRLRYAARWHGPGTAALLRGWLLLLYAGEWLVEGAKWLLGHRRPLRVARLGAYRALLASLWSERL